MNGRGGRYRSEPPRLRALRKAALAVVIAIGVTQIGATGWQQRALERTKQALLRRHQQLQEQVADLQARLAQLQLQPDSVQGVVSGELLTVFGPDADAQRVEASCFIAVPADLPLRGRLNLLADRLSRFHFGGLPIRVTEIETRNGKRIATVALAEAETAGSASWSGQYFQGSTGGALTTETLRRTFLQPDYPGAWIDGVTFTYEGEPIRPEEWDHIRLSGIHYRQPARQ